MEYYALLTVATVVIAVLAATLYRVRRDAGVLVGIAALYYWSLYGAWFVVFDKSSGDSSESYWYLEKKLFPVALDRNYLLTLALYAGFIILTELTLLAVVKRSLPLELPRLTLRHGPLLLIALLAAAGSFYLIYDKVAAAWALNTSAYGYTRRETDQWFTLHQELNRLALTPCAIGFAMLMAGGDQRSSGNRWFVNLQRRYTLAGYAGMFAIMSLFTFVLGNKAEVFLALLVGALAYLDAARRRKLWRLALVMTLAMAFLSSIDYFRSVPIAEMDSAVTERAPEAGDLGQVLTSSAEAFAAHFSMYGVLARDTQPVYGYSLYALLCSAVPRILWSDRPPDIYLYYATSVGANPDQGYSIHHATGWYLSFGYAGVMAGAMILGLTWAYFLNARHRLRPDSGMLARLFAVIGPWMFAACIPPLIRCGPEGYKGLVVDGVLIPMFALAFACRPRMAKKRLRWSVAQGWAVEVSR
jgi:hypothetical protein